VTLGNAVAGGKMHDSIHYFLWSYLFFNLALDIQTTYSRLVLVGCSLGQFGGSHCVALITSSLRLYFNAPSQSEEKNPVSWDNP